MSSARRTRWIILPLAIALILLALAYNQYLNKNDTTNDTGLLTTSKTDIGFSPDELAYFERGEGDSRVLSARLPQYIRQKIAEPVTDPEVMKNLRSGRTDMSQFGQSLVINKLLKNKTNGFFIECGAGNGIGSSNTYLFETQLNWTGILIEGHPLLYRKVVETGRNAYKLGCCLSISDRVMRTKFRISGWLTGMSEFLHRHEVRRRPAKETNVTCFPFGAIMDAIGVRHINYFSLDVEGVEIEIVKTIDFKKYRIDIIMVEFALEPHKLKRKEAAEKLATLTELFDNTKLYREPIIFHIPRTGVGLDAIFVRKDLDTS